MKRGVLLMAYGAPSSPAEIEPFYADIRGGRPPPPEMLKDLVARYARIGGASPLLEITRRQAASLQARLGPEWSVHIGMRHAAPWIRDAVSAMQAEGIREAAALVLAPHYSAMSIGRYEAALNDARSTRAPDLRFSLVRSWHTHPAFLQALETRIRSVMDRFTAAERESLTVFFTAHSLPERIVREGDPYPEQLMETSRLLAERLAIPRWQFAFQSAGRTSETWLGPDILAAIRERAAAGCRAVLVCVVGFITDHLEVLYDVDVEARELSASLGVHLERIPMLNDDPLLAECLEDLARKALAS